MISSTVSGCPAAGICAHASADTQPASNHEAMRFMIVTSST
jgi:hypothetical protein